MPHVLIHSLGECLQVADVYLKGSKCLVAFRGTDDAADRWNDYNNLGSVKLGSKKIPVRRAR